MKQNVKLSVLIVCLFLFSCNREGGKLNIINEFPDVENLIGRSIENVEFFSKGNIYLVSIDTFLIIQRNEEPQFQVYNNITYDLLATFGTKGRGPYEFIWPELLNQTDYDESNNSPVVCIYDYTRRKFTKLNILYAVNNQVDKASTEISIPRYDQFFKYFFFRDDELMIATPETDYRFVIYKDFTKNYQTVPFIPSPDFPISEELQPWVYRSSSFVNKKLGLMVSAPLFLGEIDFFDLDGNHLSSSIFFPREGLQKDMRIADINGKDYDPKYHIVQLHANDKYIVGLNHDNYQSAIYENGNRSNQNILLFDWNGDPVKKFILDKQYYINSFTVDWENSRFYGYCSEESEHNIIVYEFTL
ncbi:MAG: TolB-like 6-bladed beta-propeller domain-containing protein [Bacteroidales bacterium]|nr:TolB-like 6-bladed beta-propeller domain-containing protein [Bacteroidales bacterium]